MDEEMLARRRESWLAEAAVSREEMLERLRFQVGFAQSALKSLMLANGGALIALFSLVGSSAAVKIGSLWPAFMCFAIGLFATLMSSLCAFISQGCYYETTLREVEIYRNMSVTGDPSIPDPDPRAVPHRRGRSWEVSGIVAAVMAIILFMLGCGWALSGFAGG